MAVKPQPKLCSVGLFLHMHLKSQDLSNDICRTGETEPRAVNCVELSRAEPQHFASVLLFSIWACADRETGEMMSRKEKPGSLEKLSSWEVVHSFGQCEHQVMTSHVYSKYVLW